MPAFWSVAMVPTPEPMLSFVSDEMVKESTRPFTIECESGISPTALFQLVIRISLPPTTSPTLADTRS